MNEVQKSNQRYYVAGLDILRATPIISVADFEREIERRVQPEANDYQPIEGKRRKKWENMADWVKSYLTRRGLIRYANIGGNRYIVFAEPCGGVEGAGNLIPFDTAIRLINQLAEVAGFRAENENPMRHSAIYTVAVPDCLRILRSDATIYVTRENACQFLDNLDNGEPFELSDGTPTTVVDVPCLVSIELTVEEVQSLKAQIKYEFGPSETPKNAYSFFRFSSREQGKSYRTRRLVAKRDEYIHRHGLTLTELPPLNGQPVASFDAFLRLTLDGKIPPGSVLIVESFSRVTRNDIRSLLTTLREIMNAGVTVVSLDPEQEFSTDNILPLLMASMSADNDAAMRSAGMKAVPARNVAGE